MLHKLKSTVKKTLDPVGFQNEQEEARLEKMMGFKGQYASHRAFQMKLIKEQGLKESHQICEIGIGPMTLGLPLIRYLNKGCYFGIDIRPAMIDVAHSLISKDKLGNKNPVVLHSESFGKRELPNMHFDFIFAFSMLYHLEDDLVEALFVEIKKRLVPGGKFFANINIEHDESRWLEFPFQKREVAFYKTIATKNALQTRLLGTGAELGMDTEDVASKNIYLEFSPV